MLPIAPRDGAGDAAEDGAGDGAEDGTGDGAEAVRGIGDEAIAGRLCTGRSGPVLFIERWSLPSSRLTVRRHHGIFFWRCDVSHLEAGDWWVSIEPSRLPEHDLDWRCLVCDKVAHRSHVESKMHRKKMSLCQPQWDLSVLLTRGLGAECRRAWLGRIKSQIGSQKDHCGMLEQNNCLVQLRLRLQGQGFWLPPPPGLELVEDPNCVQFGSAQRGGDAW